jgi:protein-L-isoaspartate(D-aspartate) O-methyltransferase
MNIEQARFNMIEQQIRPWNVLDAQILTLLSAVKREDFTPPAQRSLAFVDMDLPLADGECMLSPKVEARMLQDLNIQATDRVLEIGAGSGYMAALLAHRAAQVLTMDSNPAMVELARQNLGKAGVANAEVRLGDGSKDVSGLGQFDVIVLSGSVASVPESLLALLKPQGRLVAIVGEDPIMQAHFVTRTGDSQFETRNPWDICVPRLHGFAEKSAFRF